MYFRINFSSITKRKKNSYQDCIESTDLFEEKLCLAVLSLPKTITQIKEQNIGSNPHPSWYLSQSLTSHSSPKIALSWLLTSKSIISFSLFFLDFIKMESYSIFSFVWFLLFNITFMVFIHVFELRYNTFTFLFFIDVNAWLY